MTVLWGARRGDVQYGSRDFWRRNIPIDPGVSRVTVESAIYFDVADLILVGDAQMVVRGMEGRTMLGVARA